MKRIALTIGFAATSLFLVPPATAQEVPDSEEDADFFVETIGRDVADPRAPTGFATDVDLRDLSIAGEDLGDALDRLPGLFVLRQSSYGQSAYASVRGGNPRQLSVSLADIELTIPAGLGFDVGSASPLGLERARVFRGAAGVHRGAGALTGAVELMPALPDEKGNRIQLSTLGGSYGTVATALTSSLKSEWAALELGAELRRSNGDFVFEDGSAEVRRINNDHERQAAFGNVGIQITGDSTVETLFRYEQGERGNPGPSEFQDALAGARANDRQGVAVLRFEQKKAMYGYDFGSLDTYQAAGAQFRRESYTNDSTVLGAGEFAADSDYVAASLKAGLQHFRQAREIELANVFRLDYGYKHEGYEAAERGVFTSEIDTFRDTHSISFSNEVIAWETLSILGGARYESLSGEREETSWIPFAGAAYGLSDWLELRTNLAWTYRPPDFDELYLNSEILRGDSDLNSERALAFDAGARARAEDVSGEVTFFANRVSDPIRFLPVSVYVTQAQNLDDYTAVGSEVSGAYSPHERVFLQAAYTFTHAEISEVGEQAPAVPAHAASVGAKVEFAGWIPYVERAQLGTEARVRSAMNLDVFGNIESPAWLDLGAHLLVTPVEWLNVQFTAHNLLDRRDVTDVLQQPLPGRTYYLGLELTSEEP